MGRPTKLVETTIIQAERYLAECPDSVPAVVGLASWLGVHRDTCYQWAKKNKAFSDILERVADHQSVVLMNCGLRGEFSVAITKLMLLNNRSFRDDAKRGKPLSPATLKSC